MTLLSALLTHDQVVSPQKIDEAIQRQVVYGGDFETSLLEVGALGEDTLAAYCAALHDLPPATRDEVREADPDAVARLPRALAVAHEVVPVRVEGGRLVVASGRAPDDAARAALEAAAGIALDVRVVTPPRLAWALWRFYQVPLAPRLARLTDRLHSHAPGELRPVTRPPSHPATVRPGAAGAATMADVALAALAAAIDNDEDSGPRGEGDRKDEGDPWDQPTPLMGTPVALVDATRPSGPEPPPAERPWSVAPPRPAPPATARGISLAEARRRLAEARSRDAVIEVLLDHVVETFVYAALFVVHGDACEGVAARGLGAPTEVVHGIAVPLESPSAFRAAREGGDVATAASGTGDTDAFVREDLDRREARDAVVVPIRIGARVALLLWADTDAVPPAPALVRDLAAFCAECSASFGRLILERKHSAGPSIPPAPAKPARAAPGTRSPHGAQAPRENRLQALRQALGAPPRTPPRTMSLPTPSPNGPARGARLPDPAAPVPTAAPPSAPPSAPPPASEVDRQVLEIARTGTLSADGGAALVALGAPAVQAVFRYFPGPHAIDREQVPARLPSMAESGPLLRLAVAFGPVAVPHLLAALDDPNPDARFCAMLCLAEVVDPAAVERLLPKLLDPDYPTRMTATEVLKQYQRFPEFAAVGRALRALLRDAHAPAERRRVAAHALGELRDVAAAEPLIATLGDPDCALAGAAHRALVVLTRQDFGTDTPRWHEWWRQAAERHRVEWLIDALLHAEPTIRHDASEELKKLTGQFFGYYFNLPRRERERAHQRYVDWWAREGAMRFAAMG